jgi:hypothetical protein
MAASVAHRTERFSVSTGSSGIHRMMNCTIAPDTAFPLARFRQNSHTQGARGAARPA